MTAVTYGVARPPSFAPVVRCWVCGGTRLQRFHQCRLDFREYSRQDPELAAYSGRGVWFVRCGACGFGQPEELPTLPQFFDRMYDQRWSDAWVEREFAAEYKDLIFRTILEGLDRRAGAVPRRLLDIGAHAGRFMRTAQRDGWEVEGLEVNPKTAACAEARTGASVHRGHIEACPGPAGRFTAVTLTDVLEHIPEPVAVLRAVARVVAPGGIIAIKVPSGLSQWRKERVLARLLPARRISIADNLVHVNHFSPRALALAIERAGFRDVTVAPAAPELRCDAGIGRMASNALRLGIFSAARLPGALRTPLALHLQAFARKPADEGTAA